jgi:hypothetical protein
MSVSGADRRAVSASGAATPAAAALAEVGVGRDHNLDPNQPGERLGVASSEVGADPFIRDWTPAQPEAPSSNSTTMPILRDGLMATPSAGANSIAPPVPAHSSGFGQLPCCFPSAGIGTTSDVFDWSDRLRTDRIPTSGKVPSIAVFFTMQRIGERGTGWHGDRSVLDWYGNRERPGPARVLSRCDRRLAERPVLDRGTSSRRPTHDRRRSGETVHDRTLAGGS